MSVHPPEEQEARELEARTSRQAPAQALGWAACGLVAGLALLAIGLDAADRAFPPPLAGAMTVSAEILDRDGRLLRAFATPEGICDSKPRRGCRSAVRPHADRL